MLRKLLVVLVTLVTLLAVTPSLAGAAAAAPPLPQRLAQALAVPQLGGGARTGAIAVDLTTGETVFARNDALSLAPASTEKIPVAYAALVRLRPSFRFATEVYADGERAGPVWHGHLVLRGYGDPTLTTADLRRLAGTIRAQGIRRVTGGIVADETYFDGVRIVAGWKPSYYLDESPPLSALAVDRALYRGTTSRFPALMTARVFADQLRLAGVQVAPRVRLGSVEEDDVALAAVRSDPLARIVRFMNRESDNYTAELLLKQLGAVETGGGSSAAGAAVVTETLEAAGVPLAGVRIVDGSGLSRLDRLTARSLAAMLLVAWDDPALRAPFVASLPVAGVNGTLQRRLRTPPTRGNVAAKTGTTAIASSLAGYVKQRYAFAVLQNATPRVSSWWARRAQDRFVTVLAAP